MRYRIYADVKKDELSALENGDRSKSWLIYQG